VALSHAATWVIGSVASSSLVVGSIFVASIMADSSLGNTRGSTFASMQIIPNMWVCFSNTSARGHEYNYSKNLRNGATGPARLGCGDGARPVKISPMEKRSRNGPPGPRPPVTRINGGD
jgi:hypothetical protein